MLWHEPPVVGKYVSPAPRLYRVPSDPQQPAPSQLVMVDGWRCGIGAEYELLEVE